MPELTEPGKPQQNGRHERMHKTLKDETLKPPAGNSRAQQRKFNVFRREFNELRPHEALDMHTPSQLHQASPRRMPDKLLPVECPDRFETRLVSGNGGIRWHKHWVNVSSALIGENVGLELIDDGLLDVYFGVKRSAACTSGTCASKTIWEGSRAADCCCVANHRLHLVGP